MSNKTTSKNISVTIRMPRSLNDQINDMCNQGEIGKSAFVTACIRHAVADKDKLKSLLITNFLKINI